MSALRRCARAVCSPRHRPVDVATAPDDVSHILEHACSSQQATICSWQLMWHCQADVFCAMLALHCVCPCMGGWGWGVQSDRHSKAGHVDIAHEVGEAHSCRSIVEAIRLHGMAHYTMH
eukprot:3595773-Alexandrium_andersonii.AAC.1